MEIKGMNLCDLCFSPAECGNLCEKCTAHHKNYQANAGILNPGTVLIGKYIVGRTLGRGGFGVTYLAYSNDTNKVVALKEYLPTSISYRGVGEEKVILISDDKKDIFEKGALRFWDEAQTISRFSGSDNIVSVYEFFRANNTVYYSMELLEGVDLKTYIAQKGGKLSEKDALCIFENLCDAMITVHAANVLHRDIAPDNIFMCSDGKVKLIDFGAAKQVVSNESQSYSVVLKQGFAPMEQYARKGNQGPWTDIYAAGATIYYALTGLVPPEAFERTEGVYINIDGVSSVTASVINKCMQVRVENRYQNAVDLLVDLKKAYTVNSQDMQEVQTADDVAETPDLSQVNPQPSESKKKGSNKGIVLGLISGAVVLICALVAVFVFTIKPAKNVNVALNETVKQQEESVKTAEDIETKKYTFFHNGLAPVELNGKWGYINEKGEMVIPTNYDRTYDFSENGLAMVYWSENGLCGYINKKGEMVIPAMYFGGGDFAENGLAPVEQGGMMFGYINEKGEMVIPAIYNGTSGFAENGLAKVLVGGWFGKYGYINEKGEMVIPAIYDNAYDFSQNGLAQVGIGKYPDTKYGYINEKGELVIPTIYDSVGDFAPNGFASVMLNRKRGYINEKNEMIIPAIYDYAYDFDKNGLAKIKLNGKFGYINEKGEEVIPAIYDYVDWCDDYMFTITNGPGEEVEFDWNFVVRLGGEMIIYNKDGEKVLSLNDDMVPVECGKEGFKFYRNGKYGIADYEGNIIIEPIYDSIG